jgi:hypothetical protein
MLTLINDPAGISGRQSFAWDRGATIQANIERRLASGFGCRVLINGIEVDPVTDPAMDRLPTEADTVVVQRRPEGFDPFTWVLIAVAASVAVSYALMPKINVGGTAGGNDSPNNRLTAQSNIARAYQAIPDIYGYRRAWPDLIQPSTVEYIGNVKYVTEWLCVSRGKGTISDVRYAETPIGDIDGASFEAFEPVPVDGYPELGETTLLDVLETFASDDVNGQELDYPTPFAVVTASGGFECVSTETEFTVTIPDGPALAQLKGLAPSGIARVVFEFGAGPTSFDEECTVLSYLVSGADCTFTFSNAAPWPTSETDLSVAFTITPYGTTPTTLGPYTLPLSSDRIRWNTVFLRGLKGSVVIKAEWWKVDGSGVEISGTREDDIYTYTADSFDQQFRTTEVTPTAGSGRYRIEFTRQTAQIGDQGTDVAKLEEVYAVRYYPEKVLPGVTAIRVTTKATTEATGFSDRKFNLRWLRHVRTLTSETLSSSRNFARAMAHIWTLAGKSMDQLDTDKLAAINAEFGETSDLLRFDASLDDRDMSLGERLQLAANAARCIVWRDGTKWTVTRDQARAYPDIQLDYRNLAMDGESTISYSAHLPASNDGVELEYVDETTQAKKSYVRLNISSGSVVTGTSSNPKKIVLIGSATQAQAENRAELEARRLLYQRVSVSDKALGDAGVIGPGSLVRWIDPNDFGGDDGLQAGEVLAIDDSTITTSEPVDWKGETSGRILFTGVDGQHLGAPVVCTPASGGRITLASVPAGLYLADDDRQCGSRYAFAVGLTEAEVEAAGLYTATACKPDGNGGASLAFAEYDSRLYEGDE